MPNLCLTCGHALPANAPLGFCPTCLLRGGVTVDQLEATIEPAITTSEAPMLGGRYQLGAKLGEGGFGVVFEAEQTEPLRRTVAIKVLKPGMDSRQVMARFDAERQTLALLEHPHIARVLDAGETTDGRPFFVMERVRGESVTTYVKSHAMPLDQRLQLFAAICDAVHYAHQKGIIHRDIKPSNILIDDTSGQPQPKVIDFGIAKAIEGPLTDRTVFTGMDQVLGTPGYISPEQIEHGAGIVDIRADVYALGSLLYELLCDVPVVDASAFAGKPLAQAVRELAEHVPLRPSQRKPELRGDLDAITLKALAIDPELRYASADAFAQDVRRLLRHEPIFARQPSQLYLMKKFARRHRVGVVASLAMLFVLIAASVAITMLYFDMRRERDGKQREKDKVDAMLVEARRTASMRDFREARAKSERGSHAEAVAYLCRANRIDPANGVAAAYLASELAYAHLSRQVAPVLTPPEGYDELPLIGVSSGAQQVIAVCEAPDRPALLLRWSLNDGTLKVHPLEAAARSLLVTPDERCAMLGLANGKLVECDLRLEQLRAFPPAMDGAITAMNCTPDGTRLVCGSSTGQVRVWNLIKRETVGEAFTVGSAVTKLALSASCDLALVVCGDLMSLVDPAHPGQRSAPLTLGGLGGVALQAQGHILLAGMANGQAQLRDIDTGKFIGWPLPHRGPVTAAAFATDGGVVVTGDASGGLYGWDASTGQPTGETVRMDGAVLFCQATAQHGRVLAVSDHGEVRLWEPATEQVTVHRVRKPLRAAAISRYGTLAALSQRDASAIQVWEMNGRMIEPRYLTSSDRRPAAARSVMKAAPPGLADDEVFCWDAEGARFAIADAAGRVSIGPAPVVHVQVRAGIKVMALASDAKHVATAGTDRNVSLWRVTAGKPVPLELQHNSLIQHLAFTPDGQRLVTVTDEGELRCWDVATGEPLMPSVNRGESIKTLCLAAEGRMVCYERHGGGWFLFPIPQRRGPLPEWLLQVAEALARRRLTDNGSTETLPYSAVGKALAAIPRESAVDDLAMRQLVRWLVSDPSRRPLWPDDEGTFADYLNDLIRTHDTAALREVLRFDPLNPAAARQ